MPEFTVYTDGASRKDRRGGWGYAIWFDECWWEDCGGEYETTNNRMELMGAISALTLIDSLAEPGERLNIQLWADSKYVLDGITEYVDGWEFRGWRTGSNHPVKNQDLWEMLDALARRHDIDWQWVKGHTGNEGNERADRLAGRGVPAQTEAAETSGARAPQLRPSTLPVRRRADGWGDPPREAQGRR